MSIPFLIMVLIVWIYDPLNYFGQNNIISQNRKNQVYDTTKIDMIEMGVNKKIQLSKSITDGVLIGDSRVMPIGINAINSRTNLVWFNFALPGCYAKSAAKSFFWTMNNAPEKPKIVYWGHNFWGINDIDRFSDIEDLNTIIRYVTSKRVWGYIKKLYISNNKKKDKKEQTKNVGNWWDTIIFRKQNEVSTKHIVVNPYVYTLIDSVSNYCKNHDIRLIHVYPPEYKDLLAIINSDSTTSAEYQKYLNHLSQYEFYNFNHGKWIENKEDFIDPMHPKEHVLRNIIDSIF